MKKIIVIAATVFVITAGVSAQQAPPPAPQDTKELADAKYTNESVARLSFVDGKAFVQRASDLGYENGALNMPISEGDRIGTSEGRVEVHFGKANYLRLDNDTKVDILNLPKKDDDIARIRVWSGDVFLVVGTLKKEKSIEVHTADSSFYVLDRGVYRIGVRENRDTVIEVHKGLIEAAGEEGSTLLKGSQRLVISEGRFASKPSSFIAVANDGFDKFNEARGAVTGREYAGGNLPEELSDYEADLDEYGEWNYVAPYGNVWVPNAVDDGWRPYYDGRWVWLPLSGWTWWPYEPWGWPTFHYGRWHWGFDLGWYWIPLDVWGPAWVSWWWNSYYFAWSPISYWGYPGILLGGVYYTDYYGDYYPYNSQSLTVVRRDSLRDPHIASSALSRDSLTTLDKMSLTSRTPDIRPAGTKISVQPLDGNRVLLQKDDRPAGRPDAARTTSENPRTIRRPDDPGKARGTERDAARTADSPRTVRNPDTKGTERPQGARSPETEKTPASIKKPGSGEREIREMSSASAAGPAAASVYRSDPSISGTASQTRVTRSFSGYPSSPNIKRPANYGDSGRARSRAYAGPYSRRPSVGSSSSSISRPSTGRTSGSSSGSSRARVGSSSSRGSSGASRSPSSRSSGSSSRGSSSGSSSRGSSSSSGSRGSSGGGTHKK
jgi:uncharacterized membrane protein YgcG